MRIALLLHKVAARVRRLLLKSLEFKRCPQSAFVYLTACTAPPAKWPRKMAFHLINSSLRLFIASALGEKISALKTEDYLREREQRANSDDLAAVLALVPDAEPEERDRLPSP